MATSSRTCSQLSSTSNVRSPASTAASAAGASATTGAPIVTAIVSATVAGSVSPARSTNHTRSAASSDAHCTARRVLPTPPTPVSVTSGKPSSVSRTRTVSTSRPMSDERWTGRFDTWTAARACGNVAGRSGWSSCQRRSGSSRSRRWCTPRSASGDRRRPVADQRGRHVRQHDLPAVADRHQARRPVQRASPVVVADALDLARVHAHAHVHADGRHLQLGRHRGPNGRVDGREPGRHAVTHGGEDLAARRVDRRTEHGEVGLDALGHAGRLLPLACRADDVREQQAHRGAPRRRDRSSGPGGGHTAREGVRVGLSSHRRSGDCRPGSTGAASTC